MHRSPDALTLLHIISVKLILLAEDMDNFKAKVDTNLHTNSACDQTGSNIEQHKPVLFQF